MSLLVVIVALLLAGALGLLYFPWSGKGAVDRDALNRALYQSRLQELAPQEAQRIHPNNVRRVIRALESAMQGEAVNQYGAQESPYDAVVIGLEMERQALYERINRRVDLMLAAGLEQEVRSLLEQGVSARVPVNAEHRLQTDGVVS
mgnify:CR=1 FL=1